MGHFLEELKRRNVFRVGAAYAVVAWLIFQVIETVSDPLGLPEWTEAFFIVLLLAGLPLVLIFAWAFELTPEGLKKTREVDKDESVTAHTGKMLNYAIIGVLILALGYSLWDRQGLVERVEPLAETPGDAREVVQTAAASVAVLPFVNMSADPEQEYFSDGISEELLNLLAKIPELRVPARTSSFQFKGQNLDIAEVAEQLNVAHVLEGSVRKADVRIRVTAQLIEAETGYHLWSDTYDRELTDIFQIQDEISAAIVEALSETLGLSAASAPHVTAAANPEAYNAYLLGQHLLNERTKGDIEESIVNFERAIELDPGYAPAYAGLGLAWRLLLRDRASYGNLTLEEMLAKALPPVEKALAIDPGLPDALGTMGLILDAQFKAEEALSYYEQALAINPSQTDVRNWYSMSLSNAGRETEAFAELEKAYELDPLSVITLNNFTNDLLLRRRFDQMGPVLERLTQVDPSRGANFRSFMLDEQHRKADAAIEVFRGVDQVPGNLRTRGRAAFVLLHMGMPDEALEVWPYPDMLAIVSQSDDRDYTLELAQQNFENDPTDPANVDSLAWAYFWAGQREQGLKNARRYLNSQSATMRPFDSTNWLFVIDAWQRGDEETMSRHLEPLATTIEEAFAAGVDATFNYYARAFIEFLNENREKSLEDLDVVLSRSGFNIFNLRRDFESMGWNDLPAYRQRLDAYEAYIAAERRKFLLIACGPDGFTSWQPSPETCAETETI